MTGPDVRGFRCEKCGSLNGRHTKRKLERKACGKCGSHDLTPILYPEHEKMSKVKEESQQIGLFLEWFFSCFDVYPRNTVGPYMEEAENFKGFVEALARSEFDMEYPVQVLGGDRKFNEILAQYYGIDYEELMAEKDRMLAQIRASAHPLGRRTR